MYTFLLVFEVEIFTRLFRGTSHCVSTAVGNNKKTLGEKRFSLIRSLTLSSWSLSMFYFEHQRHRKVTNEKYWPDGEKEKEQWKDSGRHGIKTDELNTRNFYCIHVLSRFLSLYVCMCLSMPHTFMHEIVFQTICNTFCHGI